MFRTKKYFQNKFINPVSKPPTDNSEPNKLSVTKQEFLHARGLEWLLIAFAVLFNIYIYGILTIP